MIDERFSAESFAACGKHTLEAEALGRLLEEEILAELHETIRPAFQEVVNRLKSMGHDLRPYVPLVPGEH